MISAADLLRVYLRGVLDALGARAASLFVPAGLDGAADAILLHEGEGPAVPELSNLAEASALRARQAPGAERGHGTPVGSIREVDSSSPDGLLVEIDFSADRLQLFPLKAGKRRGDPSRSTQAARDPQVWIGLLGVERGTDDVPEAWRPLLSMAGALASHAREVSEVFGDRLTGLPGRVEFERRLGHVLEGSDEATRPSTLLLVNPDDFGSINEKFGPDRGDQVLRLVGRRLRDTLRSSDIVARYGGAIFVALIDGTDEETGPRVARKVLDALSEVLKLDESFRLTVSAGASSFTPDDRTLRPADLIRRAEQALKVAKCGGGGRLCFWDPSHEGGALGKLDELSGVFTGNPSKDYRNMKLLSRTVTAIASSTDFDELTSVVVARIQSTLRADRVALVDWSDEGILRVISAAGPAGAAPEILSARALRDDGDLVALLGRVRGEGRTVTSVSDEDQHPRSSFGVPLVAGDACLGVLYLDGRHGRIALDSSDVEFLQALASQLALALDRARLSQVEAEWRETERLQLQAEVDELRQVFEKVELVCESPQMKELVSTARRVAQTDATVLVCGESGTGKELISRTIHDLSPRRDGSFVVVDCASIPTTLIESELFGHERGAYTGAQDRKAGRLKEADGGTVILDEIGELPLEVQSKLLRFVQEKQLTPVGGNRVIEVDARVVAATNRDLDKEVREGRFREDLYHRLDVIRLDVPPLRERPADVSVLASLFLRQFSVRYQKGRPRRLTPAAEARMLEHPWPGNVRELRNRIMQAVILSSSERIGPEQLALVEGDSSTPVDSGEREADGAAVGSGSDPHGSAESASFPDLWEALDTALAGAVTGAIEGDREDLPPLNRWLTEDLVIDAYEAANRVLTRGADALGVPEATFRRKLRKAVEVRDAGGAGRSRRWESVRPILSELVRGTHPAGEDLLNRAREILLTNVIHLAPSRRSIGAALMGVSEPTFRRWARDLGPEPERTDRRDAAGGGSAG
jgi:diguanylate cyclase (GGDEF)-like protein